MSFDDNLSRRFPGLREANPPWVFTIYGFGLQLYGRSDYDRETRSYVKTHYLCALFIPLFALGRYRVVEGVGYEMYLLGKESLGLRSHIWNLMALGLLVAIGGGIWYYNRVNSLDYRVGQQMAKAESLEVTGNLVEAAKLYRDVADSGSTKYRTPAGQKLEGLLDKVENKPLKQAADVYSILLDWGGLPMGPEDLYKRADQLLQKRGLEDLPGAMALLDVVSPHAPSPKSLAKTKLPFLEQRHTDNPEDVLYLADLALVFETLEQTDKAKKLLEPHLDKLGTTEAARILGQILLAENKNDEAAQLLMPYVQANIGKLEATLENYEATMQNIAQTAIQNVQNGTAPADIQSRIEDAERAGNNQESNRIFNDYVRSLMKNDVNLQEAQYEVEQAQKLTQSILMLAVRQQMRAERIADPDKRAAEMKKAEDALASIETVAGQRSDYRLTRGRNAYWMGKEKEGREHLDKFLEQEGQAPRALITVGGLLRELGNRKRARELSQQAFDKGTDQEKRQAAYMLALLADDFDDKLKWLKHADRDRPEIRAQIHDAQATKALADGDTVKAEQEMRACIRVYDSMPESAATLNNSALAFEHLFSLGGKLDDLEQATTRLEKSLRLEPDSSIGVWNVARVKIARASRSLTGDHIDYSTLRQQGDPHLISALYKDQATRQQYLDRLRTDKQLAQAVELMERARVLAPKNPTPPARLKSIYLTRRDLDALRRLERRLESTALDLSDYEKAARENFAKPDKERLQRGETAASRLQHRMTEAEGKPNGLTFAILASQWIATQTVSTHQKTKADADKVVTLAERIYKDFPSELTRSSLSNALLFRAHLQLIDKHPSYKKLDEEHRHRIAPWGLLGIALGTSDSVRKAATEHSDYRRAVALIAEAVELFPEDAGPWGWSIVRFANAELSKKMADIMAKNELDKVSRSIDKKLRPLDITLALKYYWYHQSQGDSKSAQATLREFAERGVPFPEQLTKE